jgi:hypothetical protein
MAGIFALRFAASRLLHGGAMKRALAVLFIGLAIVGISALAGRRSADERMTAARKAVDVDCRAYRSEPRHRHAEICRAPDPYGPKAFPQATEAKALVDHARGALARGDTREAESDLARAVAIAEDIEHIGSSFALIVRSSLLKSIVDVAEDHREIDAARLFRGVQLSAREVFATEALQWRWYLAHWNEFPEQRSRSTSNLADALDEVPAAYQQMQSAMLDRHNQAECEDIRRKHDLTAGGALCDHIALMMTTSARLDAMQHGRLSSAAR